MELIFLPRLKIERRMRIIKWFLIPVMLLFLNVQLFAQTEIALLTPAVKVEVIDNLSSALVKNYIFLDTARRMKNFIRQQLENGAYNKINSPNEFAKALTADLYSVYKDLHLAVTHNSDPRKDSKTESYIERVTKQLHFEKQQNYGFSKAEILTGNIGYIAINRFFSVNDQSAETVNSVFSFLKNTDALIIDLRNNGGGDAMIVKYICSYFFKERTHINDMYVRKTNQLYQYWTEPVTHLIEFTSMPVYILVNAHTFSGAEEFAYDMQSLHRATIIGQTTGGAAHPVSPFNISNGFTGYIPYARAINPITKTNWETQGVIPDIKTNSDSALDIARFSCYDYLVTTSKDSGTIQSAKWLRKILFSKLHPLLIASSSLKKYAGNYNGSIVSFENGNLYFTPSDGYKDILVPVLQTVFAFNNWKFEFIAGKKGNIIELMMTPLNGNNQILKRKK
jgi:hypothetical protein